MDILILKTNINSNNEFLTVRNNLSKSYRVSECTIDLEDRDKVLRVIGDELSLKEITSQVTGLGFNCEELLD
jgi:hypothetical protein